MNVSLMRWGERIIEQKVKGLSGLAQAPRGCLTEEARK